MLTVPAWYQGEAVHLEPFVRNQRPGGTKAVECKTCDHKVNCCNMQATVASSQPFIQVETMACGNTRQVLSHRAEDGAADCISDYILARANQQVVITFQNHDEA
jgi:hypothetical protein